MSSDLASGKCLVGTWREELHPLFTSSVAFTIVLEDSRLRITGIDESDGITLATLDTNWDGEVLRFVTHFAPTKHRAVHEFRLVGTDRVECSVSYVDEEGEHRERQHWHRTAVN